MERIVKKVEQIVPAQPKAIRVAAYTRVSSDKHAMLHSLSAQISYYNEMIQSHKDWIFSGIYSDEGITGTTINRPEFQRLLDDCRAGKIDFVITKSISRFARNTVTLLETVRELRNMGVGVYFEKQRINTLGPDGELMMTILASYAQAESYSASENRKWQIRKAFENGELVNLHFMFGYTIKRGKISINPAEAPIVREVFERVVAGESLSSVAKDMDRRNINGGFGGHWTISRMRDLLSNEKYTGNALLQKTFVKDHLEKKQVDNHGELPMYYVEQTHDAIISKELFDSAQQVLAEMAEKASNRAKPQRRLFTSLIICERCNKAYMHRINHGKSVWNCSTLIRKGASCCKATQIPESTLYDLTADVLGSELTSREQLENAFDLISAKDNTITYHFRDGHVAIREWQHRSRSESWTAEMRETARQRYLKQRRDKECSQEK